VGYGPTTLPLRHSDFGRDIGLIMFIFGNYSIWPVLRTGPRGKRLLRQRTGNPADSQLRPAPVDGRLGEDEAAIANAVAAEVVCGIIRH
jgi:hypothetical protein